MSLDDAIEEIKQHAEARRLSDMYDAELSTIACHIEEIVTEEQIKTWKLVETLISGEVLLSTHPHISDDDIRKQLKNIGGD